MLRSVNFSTNWTKTTGEMLPSVENDYFSGVIWLGQFFQFFMFRPINQSVGLKFWGQRLATDSSLVLGQSVLELD